MNPALTDGRASDTEIHGVLCVLINLLNEHDCGNWQRKFTANCAASIETLNRL